jgi:hypothetical protein
MKFFDRLFGRRDDGGDVPEATARRYRQQNATRAAGGRDLTDDERAIERYRYLLRTAPPETVEEAHAEAFAQLTPEQRRLVLQELSREVPERELAGAGGQAAADDPRALARLATRAEARRPGTLERTFANAGGPGLGYGGVGLGGLMAGSFLSTIAGVVVGSAIADAFFNDSGYDQGSQDGAQSAEDAGAEADAADAGSGDGFDAGATDGGDFGSDFGGDLGGDFGGDFGGEF